MDGGIRFIFKTLVKVPVIIFVSFFIFNIFSFTLTYFRLSSFASAVMQTAVQNNYLPPSELNTLQAYLDDISDTGVLEDAVIVLSDPARTGIPAATQKRQYGQPVVVGVSAQFKFIMPLMPKQQLANRNSNFQGYGPGASRNTSAFATGSTLEARRKAISDNPANRINIVYTVPGLKYYPDLN